ncbi:putative serine protease PepD [Streptomyces sp. TLI_55]|uniref:trypsin-like peptidase domain-containing protein n=1 Tax=Streptomyces sp. TLI_55 TaxID=1938861 RepID=UPI000BD9EE6F|nr:trypsin-like peptidase domain-containing protein [Streptomyces sp. TLI_55]SNX63862.1 putative serine protease PepD [Streptomyces sp. TLI_55]
MNEGKPTKAKWWSRAGGGDAALPEGDYELRRPEDASPVADPERGLPDGDFELRSPQDAPDTPDRHEPPSDDASDASDISGDFALHRPAEASATDAAAAERPKPLHDPDPYSTPPYGEPGPWAPAPPVQHPATTPSHGTPMASPAPTQPHGTPAPHHSATSAPAPHHSGAPAPAPAPHHSGAPAPAPAPTPPPTNPWQNYDPWAAAPGSPLQTPLRHHLQTPFQQNGAAVPSKEQRRKRARKALVGAAVLLALVSGGVGGVVGAYLERNGGVGDVELPQAAPEPAGRAPDSVAGIAARALPSVVTLHVTGTEESGTGTGFVLDDRGHILTNNHVVEPAGGDGEISVTFHSGDTAKATVVGRDSGYDLAVVKVSGVSGLTPLTLGNSDNVQVGDPVVAIGAPYDLEGTVTSGIISAKERPITAGGESGDGSDVSYVDALQTDAPINPGNSGGPLLDSKARVIGINSAIRSADSGSDESGGQAGSIGLGFAIPVNQAKRVAEELINTGKATHPVIGVTLDMDYSGDGARVGTKGNDGGAAVTAGGPGDKAGIEAGDVITAVDGQRIHSGEELIVKTRAHRPGDRLELTVERGGKERTISLVLGSSDGD